MLAAGPCSGKPLSPLNGLRELSRLRWGKSEIGIYRTGQGFHEYAHVGIWRMRCPRRFRWRQFCARHMAVKPAYNTLAAVPARRPHIVWSAYACGRRIAHHRSTAHCKKSPCRVRAAGIEPPALEQANSLRRFNNLAEAVVARITRVIRISTKVVIVVTVSANKGSRNGILGICTVSGLVPAGTDKNTAHIKIAGCGCLLELLQIGIHLGTPHNGHVSPATHRTRQDFRIVVFIKNARLKERFYIVLADRVPTRFTDCKENGEKYCRKYRNDRDYDQKFNKSKPSSPPLQFSSPPVGSIPWGYVIRQLDPRNRSRTSMRRKYSLLSVKYDLHCAGFELVFGCSESLHCFFQMEPMSDNRRYVDLSTL